MSATKILRLYVQSWSIPVYMAAQFPHTIWKAVLIEVIEARRCCLFAYIALLHFTANEISKTLQDPLTDGVIVLVLP